LQIQNPRQNKSRLKNVRHLCREEASLDRLQVRLSQAIANAAEIGDPLGDKPQSKGVDWRLGHETGKAVSCSSNGTPETASTATKDSELIGRILVGERDLYYQLVAPHERKVYVIAFSILRSEQEAEDCVQEAILKAWRHLDQFRGESQFGSWLVRITINEAKMRLRKLRPQLHESLDETDENGNGNYIPRTFGDWREVPSEALERKEIRELLVHAVESLREIYREVFVLRDVEGHDGATTAQILGISEVAVKTRLMRARLQLKDILAPLLKNSGRPSRQPFKKGKNPWL
jgi:RNA polymerase sigma-70 factor, ECF subfamily